MNGKDIGSILKLVDIFIINFKRKMLILGLLKNNLQSHYDKNLQKRKVLA